MAFFPTLCFFVSKFSEINMSYNVNVIKMFISEEYMICI